MQSWETAAMAQGICHVVGNDPPNPCRPLFPNTKVQGWGGRPAKPCSPPQIKSHFLGSHAQKSHHPAIGGLVWPLPSILIGRRPSPPHASHRGANTMSGTRLRDAPIRPSYANSPGKLLLSKRFAAPGLSIVTEVLLRLMQVPWAAIRNQVKQHYYP